MEWRLIYDFSPREFYQNQSLHAIFDLKIHKDTWFDAAKNPQGLLRLDNSSTIQAKNLLEARIAEINEARFNPEIQDVIRGRVEEKINRLDPNDAYYHEAALELKHIINHFGLSSELVDKMRNDYVAKFDPEKLVVGKEAYVIYDLFCRDALNPREEFRKISKEFLPKIEQSEAAKSNRGKALIAGFGKVLDMEFAEEKEFKDPENTASTLLLDGKKFDELGTKLAVKPITGTDGIPVFSSVAVAELGESGLKTKNYQSSGVASDTLFSADSMTKMVTAAAILRMTEEKKYQQKFLPKGIETKLSDLLPLLKKHYPDSTYIQTELELQPDFESITLQHLTQHTSGLARVQSGAFRDSDHKLSPDEMIDAAKKPKTGEFGERIGEYFYNDLGYELLGRVIVAIDSE